MLSRLTLIMGLLTLPSVTSAVGQPGEPRTPAVGALVHEPSAFASDFRRGLEPDEEWTPSVLFHEHTHYVVHRNMQPVPHWVSEGVAEFFSTFQLNGDGEATVGSVPSLRVNALRQHRLLPLDKMLTNDAAEVFRNDGDAGCHPGTRAGDTAASALGQGQRQPSIQRVRVGAG